MFKRILSLAILAGLLLSMAGVAQAESGYSPATTLSSSISSASSSGATSTYFNNSGGSWTTSANWNAGVPTASMNAGIGMSTTATAYLNSTSASVNNLYVGTTTAGGAQAVPMQALACSVRTARPH